MAIVVDMPKLSDTMEEGGIAQWLKKEGDYVAEGEDLVAIETDKATMEYASPEAGTLLKIIANKGSTVGLNQPIAVLGKKGESFDLSALVGSRAAKATSHSNGHAAPVQSSGPTAGQFAETKQGPGATVLADLSAGNEGGRVKASPLAKKMAQDMGLDLATVAGSGPQGRVVQRDLLALKSTPAVEARTLSVPATVTAGAARAVPNTMMRKTIAKRLSAAKNVAPHFYLSVSVNMEPLLALRENLNREDSENKISVNDLVLFTVARALKKHPEVNAAWSDEAILQHDTVHLAMAVALPTGLVTPVIPHAEHLGLRELARQSRSLAMAAKEGKLDNKAFEGGTFTVSNLGMTRVESFTAIINPPQAAILAVGQVAKVAHVNSEGQVIAQSRMSLTLSCDHRVIDGLVGARFLETLVGFMESPLKMLA